MGHPFPNFDLFEVLLGFLRLLSDIQFVSFFLVSTFKRKLLDKYDYDLLKLVKTALIFKEVTRKKLFLKGNT